MPAKPLSANQKREAEQLKVRFNNWCAAHPADDGRKPSQEDMAVKFTFGQSALSQYLNGKIPLNKEAAVQFATVLGCQVIDFSPSMAVEIAALAPAMAGDSDPYVEVARVSVQLSNGRGRIQFDEGKVASLSFRRDFLRKMGVNPSKAVVADGIGRSNEPDIKDGSVLLIDRGAADRPIMRGKFYAFRVDGELLVKKLTRVDDNTVFAESANKELDAETDERIFPDVTYRSGAVDMELIGHAFWAGALL